MSPESRSNEHIRADLAHVRSFDKATLLNAPGASLRLLGDIEPLLARLAAVERERDQLRAEKTAELDADAIIDAALRDASAATARANRAEAERDEARERLGDCIGCNYNDGPDECCPQHGRTVTEWIDIASDRIGTANDLRAERDAALARIAAVEAERDELRESLGDRTRHNDLLVRECRRLEAEVIDALSSNAHRKEMFAGLPQCSCGFSLGGGDATGSFITHILRLSLAASPTPTGPERQTCSHGYSPHCYPMCVDPEPTEETP